MTSRIAQIRARLEAATPGPWRNEKYGIYSDVGGVISDMYDWSDENHRNGEDMELIAAAPADLAWCLEEIERLKALMPSAKIRSELREWVESWDAEGVEGVQSSALEWLSRVDGVK